MVSQKVTIKNPTGLHLRPAGILCKEAIQYKSLITFSFRDTVANAKSVLSVLGACVKSGDEITLTCEGEDEEAALNALEEAEAVAKTMKCPKELAFFYNDTVKVAMEALRAPVDKLEMLVAKEIWPMPSYGDLLFEV